MSEKSSAKEELLKLASGGAVLLVLWLGASCSSSKKPKKEVATASSEESTPAKPKKIFIDLGDEVIIPAETPMARSDEAYDQYVDAKIAKDSQGIRELLLARQIRMNESPTRARFIGGTVFYRKLRILEGFHENEVWWCDRSLELTKPEPAHTIETNGNAEHWVSPFTIGQEYRITTLGPGNVNFAGRSPEDLKSMFKAFSASDNDGMAAIIYRGRGFRLSSGSDVKVIGIQGTGVEAIYHIRVDSDGRTGWVIPGVLETDRH